MPTTPSALDLSLREFVARVESGEPVHVLDVRAPERLASGTVDLVPPERFHNVQGSRVLASEPRALGLPSDALVAVVCGRGNDSRTVAAWLRERGIAAVSLAGGLAAYAHLLVPREVAPTSSLDRLVQGDRVAKGALCYLLVSEGEAVLVDPPRRVEAMLEIAAAAGARLVAVCDTHVHADYVSGAPGIADRLGIPYYLHPADAVSPFDGRPGRLDFRPAPEGTALRFGRASLVAMHTPGHTEGSVTWMLPGEAAFTGDFVFVGSIGRPDLGGQAGPWTEALHASVLRARREWPPHLRIFPAHWTSAGERSPRGTVEAEFGALLATNEPLGLEDAAAFRAWVAARAGSFPGTYRNIKRINLGLEAADPDALDVLEAGRNQCALG